MKRKVEAIDAKPTPQGIKLIALGGDHLRDAAYRIADELKAGRYYTACVMLCSFTERERIPALLELILQAYKDSARFEPTTERRRIIEAFYAAAPFWIDGEPVTRTLAMVKQKFQLLYGHEELPGDETFKRAFRELPQLREWWRKGKGGRPRGSKDQDPRKRRKGKAARKTAPEALSFLTKSRSKLRRRAGMKR